MVIKKKPQVSVVVVVHNMQREAIKQDRLDKRQAAELEVKLVTNREDNDTAKQIAAMEAITGEKVGVSTGTGINP